jgi:hypothetical protein
MNDDFAPLLIRFEHSSTFAAAALGARIIMRDLGQIVYARRVHTIV